MTCDLRFVPAASCRLLSTASCFLKESFTSYDKKDVTLTDETVATSNFSSGEMAVVDNYSSSRGRLHSSLAEYTLDEDGFMNIEDLVDFLKRENAMDICVIKTSGDRRSYVDYFVIVSGVSVRHLRAMAKNLEQLVGRIVPCSLSIRPSQGARGEEI